MPGRMAAKSPAATPYNGLVLRLRPARATALRAADPRSPMDLPEQRIRTSRCGEASLASLLCGPPPGRSRPACAVDGSLGCVGLSVRQLSLGAMRLDSLPAASPYVRAFFLQFPGCAVPEPVPAGPALNSNSLDFPTRHRGGLPAWQRGHRGQVRGLLSFGAVLALRICDIAWAANRTARRRGLKMAGCAGTAQQRNTGWDYFPPASHSMMPGPRPTRSPAGNGHSRQGITACQISWSSCGSHCPIRTRRMPYAGRLTAAAHRPSKCAPRSANRKS